MSNPLHLQLSYLSFFFVQTFDCLLFLSLTHQLFPDRTILTPPTQFFIFANATTLFPFVLLVFLLRDHHVSSDVGKRVALAFTLFHGLVLVLQGYQGLGGGWCFDQFWASVGFHGVWFVSGAAALAGY
jgi:hypothetical protein